MYWGLGLLFGPAMILGISLYSTVRAPNFVGLAGNSMSVVYLAGAISGLSSLIYLLLLKRGQARAEVYESAAVL
jgi:hypothetical protein